MKFSFVIGVLFGAAASMLVGGGAALAQQEAPPIVPKNFELFDPNGVSLLAPDQNVKIKEPGIGIGDPNSGGLYFQRTRTGTAAMMNGSPAPNNWEMQLREHNLLGTASYTGISLEDPVPKHTFTLGGQSEMFLGNAFGPPYSTEQTGSSIDCSTSSPCIYHRSDGAVLSYEFAAAFEGSPQSRITSMTKPDGEVITWHYYAIPSGTWAGIGRLQSVTNNLGYQIHFQYEQDATPSNNDQAWRFARIKKITAINNALNPCAPTAFTCDHNFGGEWPYLIYDYDPSGTSQTVTDRLNNVHRFYYDGNIQTTTPVGVRLIAYRSPAAAADDISIQYNPLRVTNARGQWTYTFTAAVGPSAGGVTQVSGPNGYAQTIQYSYEGENPYYPPPTPVPLTVTTNGRAVTYEYQFTSSFAGTNMPPTRLKKVINPEGDFEEYEYDARRNITHVRSVAKPGSGLPDIHRYATYPDPTEVVCPNKKVCNKPLTVTDARGNVTTLSYDANHGGVLTVTKPVPGSGPYASIQPQVRNAYSDNGTGIVRLASVSTCKTTSSCTGTADETVVETTYNAKRMPSTVMTRAGDSSVSSTVTTTYTPQGDVATIDGPLSGSADTTYSYYDSMRRPRAIVTPDPDGGGPLLYGVTRTTYNADSNPVMVEKGEVGSPASWDSLTVYARSTTEYDAFGRKVRGNAINLATGLPETVAQTSYDVAGRVACVAQRMNPAVYGSLPDATQIQPLSNPTGGACAHSTTGPNGPDRIVHTTYDANDDPLVIQSSYGTALQRDERTMTYLAPGQLGTLKDAANNLTTLEYDGFNRLKKTRYPVATVGGNTSSTTDFEQFDYDAAGNITWERRRGPEPAITATSTYDALNRLRTKDFSDATPDVTNSYDNLDHLVTASSGNGTVSWEYDALDRVKFETQPNGTVTYSYNDAGQRTQLTYPGGGFAIHYQYYDDGTPRLVGLNGTSDVLANYYYDTLRRRASVCRSAGTPSACSSGARTVYGYDAVSRLAGLSHDLVTGASTYDLSTTFTYSPASQLTSRTASSYAYDWPYAQTFNDGYSVNGLNQYTTVAGQGLAYDDRGNTTNDTTKSYTYDAMNRLTGSSNGASALYDATGRLFQISQGGTTTRFLYDGTRLIAEYDGAGTLQRRYVHGDGVDDPMVWFEGSGTGSRNHLFKDERGSVMASDNGSSVTKKQYDEYGNAAGNYSGRFQYTGQTWMPELGLYYYKARAYNPDLGRFMQTDPIGTKDQMNLYAYVGNDPLNAVDPTGTSCKGTQDAIDTSSCKIDLFDITTDKGTYRLNNINQLDKINISKEAKADIAGKVAKIEAAMTKEFKAALAAQKAGKGDTAVSLAGNKALGIPSSSITLNRMVDNMRTGTDVYTNTRGAAYQANGMTVYASGSSSLRGFPQTFWPGLSLSDDLGGTFIHERLHYDRVGDAWARYPLDHQKPFADAVGRLRQLFRY